MLGRPEKTEYSAAVGTYIEQVNEEDIVKYLREQMNRTLALLQPLSQAQWEYRYQPEKWSVKEVIGHLMDNERIASYRMLCIARGDTTPLPGYDENIYAKNAGYHDMAPEVIMEDYRTAREGTLAIMRSAPPEAWLHAGSANGAAITARAVAYMIAGHERHHIQVLQERYRL